MAHLQFKMVTLFLLRITKHYFSNAIFKFQGQENIWPRETSAFLSPAHEVGAGDIVITMSVCASVFHFLMISLKPLAGLLSYYIHTSFRRCRCAFRGLWLLTFDFEVIIDLKWLRMINSVSGWYLAKRLLDCFHTAHTHPSGGVDVPFVGYDLWLIIDFN